MVTRVRRYQLQCLYCGESFSASRRDAKFHTDACRVAYARANDPDRLSGIEGFSGQELLLLHSLPSVVNQAVRDLRRDYGLDAGRRALLLAQASARVNVHPTVTSSASRSETTDTPPAQQTAPTPQRTRERPWREHLHQGTKVWIRPRVDADGQVIVREGRIVYEVREDEPKQPILAGLQRK